MAFYTRGTLHRFLKTRLAKSNNRLTKSSNRLANSEYASHRCFVTFSPSITALTANHRPVLLDKRLKSTSALFIRSDDFNNVSIVEVDLNLSLRLKDVKKLEANLKARKMDRDIKIYELVSFKYPN